VYATKIMWIAEFDGHCIFILCIFQTVLPNKYDALSSLHHLNIASGAHGGPNFLGWHWVYLVL